ncbi:SprT-like domain-containing protein [Paraglaciecola Antarctic GD virus 1]|nr:SprT-like domain-containing protein [Paraglaciecola Antarctic GD virus 1]
MIMSSYAERKQAILDIRAKFLECKKDAEEKYGVNMGLLTLRTTLRGTKMGSANMSFAGGPKLWINLNINAINGTKVQRDYVIDVTIPHEMAHIVNFLLPSSGKDHNRGWKSVCLALGGNGTVKYSGSEVGNISSSKNYNYLISGKNVSIGRIRHGRIQAGTTSYNFNDVEILKSMWDGTRCK